MKKIKKSTNEKVSYDDEGEVEKKGEKIIKSLSSVELMDCLHEACDRCRGLNYRVPVEKLLEEEINKKQTNSK